MPRKGLPFCEHKDGSQTRDYWFIKGSVNRGLIECKHCGKQRRASSWCGLRLLERKPEKAD